MMNETPVKVVSLLGVALTSLAFLFAVTVSDASFSGTQSGILEPINTTAVLSSLDDFSNSYRQFLTENLFTPVKNDYAMVSGNISWVSENASDQAISMMGIQSQTEVALTKSAPKVAGAVTNEPYKKNSGGFSVDSLFAMLSIK